MYRSRLVATLGEALRAREWTALADIVEGDPAVVQTKLEEAWSRCLASGDVVLIVGMASLWSSRERIAQAASRCVRLVAVRTDNPQPMATLEVVERWARGEIDLDEVWRAGSTASERAYEGDEIAELVSDVASAAGDQSSGFDEEALNAAIRAVSGVIELGIDPRQVIELLASELPSPSLDALVSAVPDMGS